MKGRGLAPRKLQGNARVYNSLGVEQLVHIPAILMHTPNDPAVRAVRASLCVVSGYQSRFPRECARAAAVVLRVSLRIACPVYVGDMVSPSTTGVIWNSDDVVDGLRQSAEHSLGLARHELEDSGMEPA